MRCYFILQTSLYPYVCKRKAFPTGHPKCLIGPKLNGYSVNDLEGVVRCTVLPPRTLYIPLLPSKINGKLLFTLCRTCAELQRQGKCNHGEEARALTGTWVSLELRKAVKIGYTVLQLHEAWHYDHTMVYD